MNGGGYGVHEKRVNAVPAPCSYKAGNMTHAATTACNKCVWSKIHHITNGVREGMAVAAP